MSGLESQFIFRFYPILLLVMKFNKSLNIETLQQVKPLVSTFNLRFESAVSKIEELLMCQSEMFLPWIEI